VGPRLAAGIVATIVFGLGVDAHGGVAGQPVVNCVAWALFAYLLGVSTRADRIAYLVCLLLATVGEVFLALVWGVYDYRLGNLPLFVPPGHVLLYALGKWIAERVLFTARAPVCIAVLAIGAALAASGKDGLSAPLAVLFVLCMRYGSAPGLYAVMFGLALAMELLGTALGNWTWRATVPWVGWPALNPPFAAGAFYCALDLLVGWFTQRARHRSAARAPVHRGAGTG
jgi:hypothetical protein